MIIRISPRKGLFQNKHEFGGHGKLGKDIIVETNDSTWKTKLKHSQAYLGVRPKRIDGNDPDKRGMKTMKTRNIGGNDPDKRGMKTMKTKKH